MTPGTRAWRVGIACVCVVVLVVIAWGYALRLIAQATS